jgi:rubrerythrin
MAQDRTVDLSKRAWLTGIAGAGALTTLATLIGPAYNPALAVFAQGKPSPATDAAFINEAIKIEQKAVNTYKAALKADLLKDVRLADAAGDFANDHASHRDALSWELRRTFKNSNPAIIENLGTFPIPEEVVKGKEADVLRYALTVEMIASKTYMDAVSGRLATDDARGLIAAILTVETQHVAVFRSVLTLILKAKGLPDDKDMLVPFAFFNDQPTPALPS